MLPLSPLSTTKLVTSAVIALDGENASAAMTQMHRNNSLTFYISAATSFSQAENVPSWFCKASRLHLGSAFVGFYITRYLQQAFGYQR